MSEIKATQDNLWGPVVFQYFPTASMEYIITNRSPDNNLSAKTKLQNGVTQGAVFFHLVSGRKSASIL